MPTPQRWQNNEMGSAISIGERASLLVQQNRASQAFAELNEAAARNDPEAIFTLAVWRLSGSVVPRDLALSRNLFRLAADLGHLSALRVYNAFLANGTGGPVDWSAAMELLSRRSAFDQDAANELKVLQEMRLTEQGNPIAQWERRILCESPHLELLPKAFTPVECLFLIAAAELLFQPALTVHPQTGQRLPHPVRTSDSAGFPLAQENPAICALNRRIAAISGLPVNHGEPLQVLRYRQGQQYRLHADVLPGSVNQRVVTVLVYLNDDYEGGETHFPASDISVRGHVGDALLFRNVQPDGNPDTRAVHAGLPVTSGVKMIASRWIRAAPLDLGG